MGFSFENVYLISKHPASSSTRNNTEAVTNAAWSIQYVCAREHPFHLTCIVHTQTGLHLSTAIIDASTHQFILSMSLCKGVIFMVHTTRR